MRRPPFARLALAFVLVATIPLVSACAQTPLGPSFTRAELPPEHRGRVYVYRNDPRTSLAVVNTSIDGRTTGTFRNREYQTVEIAAGSHRLRAGMRGFAFLNLGWNDHTFRVRPGEVVYLKLEVRLDSRASATTPAAPRELEIGGRPEATGTENIFIREVSEEAALEELAITTRLPAKT